MIGVSLIYTNHIDEVGIDTAGELLLFPKPVVPTGLYASVHVGAQIGVIPGHPSRNPFKGAKLGVVEEGAWADILIWNGDPTRDLNLS